MLTHVKVTSSTVVAGACCGLSLPELLPLLRAWFMLPLEERLRRAFFGAGPSTVAAAGHKAAELRFSCFTGKAEAGLAPTDEVWLSLDSEADSACLALRCFAEGAG